MSDRPNIILFNPDQWRGDVLGHMGNPAAQTPVLDRFVQEEAVSFRNAFCQNPVCTPSRCSFMSGWYPHVRGHRTMFHMMKPDEPVLLRTLKENGYYVWWGGKNDLIPAGTDVSAYCDYRTTGHGPKTRSMWDTDHQDKYRGDPDGDNYYSFYFGELDTGVDDIYQDSDWTVIQEAIEFLKNPPDQPFCMFLALVYPHPPFAVEAPWFDMVDRDTLPPRIPAPEKWDGKPGMTAELYERLRLKNWDEDRWNELRAVYYGMCARVDHQFGLLLDALKQGGSYDDSAVFFFSDHGEYAGDYSLVEKAQNTFEDCLTNVPFVVKPPADVPVQPRITDAMVELIDIVGTVEALTGVQMQEDHFGRSLLDVIAGNTEDHRDAVFCQGGRRMDENQAKELESTSHQNPSGLYYPRLSIQAEDNAHHTKAIMCCTKTHKYVHRLYETDELYDLENDPQELHNRIDDPDLKAIQQGLQQRLMRFLFETADVVPRVTDRRF